MTDKSVDEILNILQQKAIDCPFTQMTGLVCFCKDNREKAKTQLRELVMGCVPKEILGGTDYLRGYNQAITETTKAIERLFNDK